MIRDERISKTKNQIAASGFGIWYILLLISLLYRQFYLDQPATEYWDIALIFFIGTFCVAIAGFAKGAVYESAITRFTKRTIPIIVITIVLLSYFQGNVNTLMGILEIVLLALIGLSVVGILFYYLYRRWERQNELNF